MFNKTQRVDVLYFFIIILFYKSSILKNKKNYSKIDLLYCIEQNRIRSLASGLEIMNSHIKIESN